MSDSPSRRPPLLPGAEAAAFSGGDVGVLLCHGFTGTPQSLRPWARALAVAGCTVRLPRLPGHGTTWQECNRTTWPQWYGIVAAALEDLSARCSVVVVGGLSMGGALAALLAADHPDVVTGLMLVNPAFRVDDRRLALLPALRFVVPSLAGIADDRARTDGEAELAYSRTPLHALHSQTRLWRHVVDRLDRVTAPVLLMTSTTDHVVPPSSAELFLRRVRAPIRHVVLENSFHVATLDHDAPLVEAESIAFVRDRAREATQP